MQQGARPLRLDGMQLAWPALLLVIATWGWQEGRSMEQPAQQAPPPGTRVELIGRLLPDRAGPHLGGRFEVRERGTLWVEAEGRDLAPALQAIRSAGHPFQRVVGTARQLREHPGAEELPPAARQQLFTVELDLSTLCGIGRRAYERSRSHLRMVEPS